MQSRLAARGFTAKNTKPAHPPAPQKRKEADAESEMWSRLSPAERQAIGCSPVAGENLAPQWNSAKNSLRLCASAFLGGWVALRSLRFKHD